ncbi:MAG: cyclic pyranopterin monophosphate synthase MoaC [Armatimonadetes bacterium]|nr:MAG: cyclic pyranopterin monophosphate synthase MoaC [Armatimonadota bacterium]
MSELSHTDDQGNARMVDVSDKQPTERRAVAEGFLRYTNEHWRALRNLPKGDALTVAQIAGILGAKRTSDLIPMCHPIPLSHVDVDLNPTTEGIEIRATTKTTDRTGVEMEALTAVAIAALTLFDMLKSISSDMTIERVRLMEKTGGKQNWKRSEESDSQS